MVIKKERTLRALILNRTPRQTVLSSGKKLFHYDPIISTLSVFDTKM